MFYKGKEIQMLTLFKPYGNIFAEERRYGHIVNVLGVTEPEGPAREAEIREKMKICDILQADVDIAVNKELIEGAENLRAIVCTSIGTDYVNIREMTEAGIPVANNPDFCIEAVAEFAISLMFSIVRRIPKAVNGVAENDWLVRYQSGGIELKEKTLGLIGFGRIGREVARMASAIGMRVIAFDKYINTDLAESMGVESVDIEDIYAQSDVISIHCPLTEETRGMINRTSLEKMKMGVYLINVSRGGIIVEDDILEFIQNGKLAGLALDVLGVEPPVDSHPLIGLSDQNVIITPHMAWNTREADEKAFLYTLEQIKAISEGEVPPSVLNKEVLSNPRLADWFGKSEI